MDEILILPWQPQTIIHHLQFDINMGCGSGDESSELIDGGEGNTVFVEFSTDRGRSWSLVRGQCLPVSCQGSVIAESSLYSDQDLHDG